MTPHGYEIYIREVGENEVALTGLTDKRERCTRSPDPTPEEVLLAREQLADEERRERRKLSREMTRALVWMGTEEPERVRRMIDRFLPIEEAYILRRYLLHRDFEEDIGRDMGVTGQGVGQRLYRALWRLRVLQDVAWDLTPEALRKALDARLGSEDVALVVVFWAEAFSRSRTAKRAGKRQQQVGEAMARIVAELEPHASGDRAIKRIHGTLLEVQRRKLWGLSAYTPAASSKRNAMRMPGTARVA